MDPRVQRLWKKQRAAIWNEERTKADCPLPVPEEDRKEADEIFAEDLADAGESDLPDLAKDYRKEARHVCKRFARHMKLTHKAGRAMEEGERKAAYSDGDGDSFRLRQRRRVFRFVVSHEVPLLRQLEGKLKPETRINWVRITQEWQQTYSDSYKPSSIERLYRLACADPRIVDSYRRHLDAVCQQWVPWVTQFDSVMQGFGLGPKAQANRRRILTAALIEKFSLRELHADSTPSDAQVARKPSSSVIVRAGMGAVGFKIPADAKPPRKPNRPPAGRKSGAKSDNTGKAPRRSR